MKIHKKIAIIVTVLNLLILGGLAFAKFFSLTENIVYFVALFTFWLGILWEGIVGKIFRRTEKPQVQTAFRQRPQVPERRPLPQKEYPQETRQLPPRQVAEQPRVTERESYQQIREKPTQEPIIEDQRPVTFHEPHPVIDTLKEQTQRQTKKKTEEEEEFDYLS